MAFQVLGQVGKKLAGVSGPTPGQIKLDIDRKLKAVGFAAIVALTRTGQKIKAEQPLEMSRVFDRPKPFTLNSVFLKPATKAEPWVRVWLKDQMYSDSYSLGASRASRKAAGATYRISKRMSGSGTPAAKYLMPQIAGGQRSAKGFEVKMRSVGLLGPGEFIVPGTVKLDNYGNIPNGLITSILSDQGALTDPMSNRAGTSSRAGFMKLIGRTEKKKRSKFFVATIKGTRAIWQRLPKRGITPLLIIINRPPQYRQRYDFVRTANNVFDANFANELRRAVAEGFSKAKR